LSEKARDGQAQVILAALDGGVHELGKKILEEAGEVWLAAEHKTTTSSPRKSRQLLYWIQVLMIARNISLDDMYRKL
jgi:phosphoribosyl-ATP pyrophosphohydrolase